VNNIATVKKHFFKTKILFTGIFFMVYILYRGYGCEINEYLCGQSLGVFIPIFFMCIYYILIGCIRLSLRFLEIFDRPITVRKLIYMDRASEILFYLITTLLIISEQGNPFLGLVALGVFLTDLIFVFVVFRSGFLPKFVLNDEE
jgi:hypothetical protein